MSEHIQQEAGNFDAIVSNVDKWFMEPLLAGMFDDIREQNKLLIDSPKNQAEINGIIYDIESRWSELEYASCELTGCARFPDIWHFDPTEIRHDSDRVPIKEYSCKDENLYLNGVFPVETGESAEDENDSVLYKLQVAFIKEDIDIEGKQFLLRGRCDVDQIEKLELHTIMSTPRAVAILESLQPKLLEKINKALLEGDPGMTNTERLMRLTGLSLKPDDVDDYDNMELVMRALSAYTAANVEIDVIVPHKLSTVGSLWVTYDNAVPQPAQMMSDQALFIAAEITWEQSPVDGEDCLIPHLLGRMCEPDAEKPMSKLIVPLESISNLQSIRHEFFANKNDTVHSELEYNI